MISSNQSSPIGDRKVESMHAQKRQNEILNTVRLRGACSIVELAKELQVSDETIRRTIKPLVAQGMISRVHGGIVLNENLQEPPFQRRMQENLEAKRSIAQLVLNYIKDGDSIMIDTGSTTAYVAHTLRTHSDLFVVTNCTEIGRILAPRRGNRVHITGGELRADDSAAFGTSAITFARQFQVHYAILSIGGISDRGEFMDFHLCEAEFSRTLMEQAQKTLIVADHSKFGRVACVKVCDPQQVNVLFTDQQPPAPLAQHLAEAGITVITPENRE